jgi:hypothetical protein
MGSEQSSQTAASGTELDSTMDHNGSPAADNDASPDAVRSPNTGFSSADIPAAPSGISTNLQPGGVRPGGGPAASVGSIGTGSGQTAGHESGSKKRDGC